MAISAFSTDLRLEGDRLRQLIERSQRFLLVSHRKPDGDTLGASLAMRHYLEAQGKQVWHFCRDEVPATNRFLPGAALISQDVRLWEQVYDAVLVFDAGDLQYAGVDQLIGKLPQGGAQRAAPLRVDIDHHVINTRFGAINLVDTQACSTCEVVFRLFQMWRSAVTPDMATCCLAGIINDTGTFTNSATTDRSVAFAAELLRHGAQLTAIARNYLQNRTMPSLRLWGRALARLQLNTRYGIAVTALTMRDFTELGADHEQAEGIANFLQDSQGPRGILILTEQGNGLVKGSFRTTRDDLDFAHFAAVLGGGGHRKASGFTIPGRLEQQADGTWRVLPVARAGEEW